MDKIRWGIMATGRIAATFADAVNYVEDAVLYACASRDLDRAKSFAERFGVEKYYDDYWRLYQMWYGCGIDLQW